MANSVSCALTNEKNWADFHVSETHHVTLVEVHFIIPHQVSSIGVGML